MSEDKLKPKCFRCGKTFDEHIDELVKAPGNRATCDGFAILPDYSLTLISEGNHYRPIEVPYTDDQKESNT